MKNLLSVLAVSTLVGTSASNLKPVFTNNVINHGLKSNQLNNKDISITNQNVSNPFLSKPLINGIVSGISLSSVIVAPNGTIYAGTDGKGLWKSTDGFKFEQVKSEISNTMFVTSIAIAPNGTWLG